jgi:hypothetical protein
MALLSNTNTPPSSIAGTLPFGFTLRNSGLNWSPVRVSTGTGSKGRPASSRNSATLVGFGAALK